MGHQPWQRRLLLAVIGLFALTLVGSTLVSSFHWIHKPFPGFFLHENLSVGPYFLPGWSGTRAGLEPLDFVVAVEGRPLRQRGELYAWVKSAPSGARFHYRVMRDGQMLDFTIPSMSLSLHDWFLSFGVYVVVGLAFLIIGVTPYYLRAFSPVALPLCFMVLAVFVWFETTFDFMTVGTLPKELRLFGLTLTPGAGVHLALLLKHGKPLWQSNRTFLLFIYGISLLLGGLNSVMFFGPPEFWIQTFRVGYIYTCVGAVTFLAIVGSALRANKENLECSRLRVIAVGAVLGFFLPTLSTVMTSSFQWEIPYNLALVPTVFFPLSIAYALLKYSLFELGNALKVALTRIALTAFLLVMYAVVVVLLRPWVGSYEHDPLIPLFFSVVVVLGFNPLLRWIEGAADRYIYRQDYDAAQVQGDVSLFLRSLATAPSIAKGFIRQVTDRIGIDAAVLVYRPKESRDVLVSATDGVETNFTALDGKLQALAEVPVEKYYHGVSRGEVTTNPHFHRERDLWLDLFDLLKAELLIPIVFERQTRGIVSFGSKRSHREYSTEDLHVLGTLTEQLALSLENGRLYDELVKAYHQTEAMNKKLIEMDRVKKQFVANICHELRTPVSAIIGYSEVLLDPNYHGNSRKLLERLVNNGTELSHLMDNLLNFSRMEADGAMAQHEAVKLQEILNALKLMTQRLIRERPIEFKINMESPLETIQSDGQKLQQILVQLLTNAVKFTEKGKIEVKVRTVLEGGEESVEFAVADTGIGIDGHDQEIIFEEFRQVDGSSTRQYGGTGLGLSLCRKLARALGGTINVTSEKGVGSVFSLLLPLSPSPTRASGIA